MQDDADLDTKNIEVPLPPPSLVFTNGRNNLLLSAIESHIEGRSDANTKRIDHQKRADATQAQIDALELRLRSPDRIAVAAMKFELNQAEKERKMHQENANVLQAKILEFDGQLEKARNLLGNEIVGDEILHMSQFDRAKENHFLVRHRDGPCIYYTRWATQQEVCAKKKNLLFFFFFG